MADFLEEVLFSTVKYGSSWHDEYSVNVVETSAGSEYRSLIHAYPKRVFKLDFELATANMWPNILDLYHRAHGTYAGFRVLCVDEDSSNGPLGTPTPLDQQTLVLTATTRQIIKVYGMSGTAGASGYPYRQIKKPIAGTVVAAKNGVTLTGGQFSVNTTTGVITVPTAIISDTITTGFRFHFPARFRTVLEIGQDHPLHRMADGVEFIELLNP
jgi:uncharacterized protein (TIGR02217 family)